MGKLIPQGEYVEQMLKQAEEELGSIPRLYAEYKRDREKRIDAALERAGIFSEVDGLRKSIESEERRLQSKADRATGRRAVLVDLHEKYLLAPIPEGVTHLYGIELEALDPQTRLLVMYGQDGPGWHETIATLGGDPELREWDGTWEDEEEVPATTDEVENPTGPKPSPTPARAPKKRGPTKPEKTRKGKKS